MFDEVIKILQDKITELTSESKTIYYSSIALSERRCTAKVIQDCLNEIENLRNKYV